MRFSQLRKIVDQLVVGGGGGPGTPDWSAAYSPISSEPDALTAGLEPQDWGYTGVWILSASRPCLVIVELTNNGVNGYAMAALQLDESNTLTMAGISSGFQGSITQSFVVPPGTQLRCEGSYHTGDPDGGAVTAVQVVPFV